MGTRNVTTEDYNPRSRFVLYRLCDCPTCEGKGKAWGEHVATEGLQGGAADLIRCPDCRGEGRVRQEVASCESPEAVGVALVTLGREGEWSECPFGLLDREPECETCAGKGRVRAYGERTEGDEVGVYLGALIPCPDCKGSGVKPTGTWLVLPWLPSARNVTDAARTLAKSKKRSTSS